MPVIKKKNGDKEGIICTAINEDGVTGRVELLISHVESRVLITGSESLDSRDKAR